MPKLNNHNCCLIRMFKVSTGSAFPFGSKKMKYPGTGLPATAIDHVPERTRPDPGPGFLTSTKSIQKKGGSRAWSMKCNSALGS